MDAGRVIAIFVAAALIPFFVILCAAVSVIVILARMGPAVGNVFSNIVENIVTPTP